MCISVNISICVKENIERLGCHNDPMSPFDQLPCCRCGPGPLSCCPSPVPVADLPRVVTASLLSGRLPLVIRPLRSFHTR